MTNAHIMGYDVDFSVRIEPEPPLTPCAPLTLAQHEIHNFLCGQHAH